MKIFKSKFFYISLLFIFFVNICAFFAVFQNLPEKVTISPNETNGRWLPKSVSWLLSSEETKLSPAMENSSEKIRKGKSEQYIAKIYLCGVLPVKTVELSLISEMYVVPGGEALGINLKTDGLLVVGISEFESEGHGNFSPAQKAGIRTGDIITKINGAKTEKAISFSRLIESSGKDVLLEGLRGDRELSWQISPAVDKSDGKRKIGLWIRESIAGIGTASFYFDEKFAALGHPISDIDTGESVKASKGYVCRASIIGVDKGEKGSPGSLKGVFCSDNIGELYENSFCGIYGTLYKAPDRQTIKLASKEEVYPGKVKLRCSTGGVVKSYDAKIVRINPSDTGTKSMIIEITDKELLNKTGGIVQGMSGSPIIQNDKLVGVLTHVFVNDPGKGYAVFAETMAKQMIK